MNLLDKYPFLANREDYQKDNFSKFLQKIGFVYKVPSIHIAGTNGKGSTATYIAKIYEESGLNVGLFTSPYFYTCNEMIQINGNNILDGEMDEIIKDNIKYIQKYCLSEFELETFIALTYFTNKKVDVAVIECGMGGEIDATNIFTPILSIITSVALEHTNYLGRSIAEIAINKGGIIKKNIPTLIGELDNEAEMSITDICLSLNSKLHKISTVFEYKNLDDNKLSFSYGYYKNIIINSSARYECKNAALAIEAVSILNSLFKVNENIIKEALKKTTLINRFELLSNKPLFLIDGAHNVEAISTLVESIMRRYRLPTHIIFCSFLDKNIALMLPKLALLSEDITLTSFNHPRSRSKDDYFLFLEEYKYNPSYVDAIKEAIAKYPEDLILVTGSLAFVSRVRKDYLDGKFNG